MHPRTRSALLLAAILVIVQGLLVYHQEEIESHKQGFVCEYCLAGAVLGAMAVADTSTQDAPGATTLAAWTHATDARVAPRCSTPPTRAPPDSSQA